MKEMGSLDQTEKPMQEGEHLLLNKMYWFDCIIKNWEVIHNRYFFFKYYFCFWFFIHS